IVRFSATTLVFLATTTNVEGPRKCRMNYCFSAQVAASTARAARRDMIAGNEFSVIDPPAELTTPPRESSPLARLGEYHNRRTSQTANRVSKKPFHFVMPYWPQSRIVEQDQLRAIESTQEQREETIATDHAIIQFSPGCARRSRPSP